MLFVLAAVVIAAWVYLAVLGFRLNREGLERGAQEGQTPAGG